jgi:hypothetical protein
MAFPHIHLLESFLPVKVQSALLYAMKTITDISKTGFLVTFSPSLCMDCGVHRESELHNWEAPLGGSHSPIKCHGKFKPKFSSAAKVAGGVVCVITLGLGYVLGLPWFKDTQKECMLCCGPPGTPGCDAAQGHRVQRQKARVGKFDDLEQCPVVVMAPLAESDDQAKMDGHGEQNDKVAEVRGVCVLCYENPVDRLLQPCNHVVACSESDCGSHKFDECPICRVAVTNELRVHLS